jgi:YfiH family protein
MYRLDVDQILRVSGFEAFAWLEHGFGTNRSAADWPDPANRATLKQVHSTRVTVAFDAGNLGEGDAMVTNRPRLFVAIKTADCIPILLVDPVHRAVAAVHAGWRGTAGNIVRSTIDTMVSEFHTKPAEVWAAIGPGIGKCCYQVSGSVAKQFAAWMPEHTEAADGTMLHLKEVNRIQMLEAGVGAAQIESAEDPEWCTRCQPVLFHSFRREGERAGRMYSAIRIRAAS